MVESESEEGHDRRYDNVLKSDEATANDAVTNQNTTPSVVTENHYSKDGNTFDCIVSREESVISLSRILKLTNARVIYAMISVTFVQTILLYVILQRRKT